MADKNPFSINPCLFIGIGTNGWRILQELRQLIYEEFGLGGLPCFRYIGIESDSGKRPDDSFLPHPPDIYEKVTPVYISIPDVNVIRRRLDSKMKEDYMPGMVEWLDVNLIDRGNKSYQAGAGNARQAGRMCLWGNWNQFKQAVDEGLDWLQNSHIRDETEVLLRKEYFGKKLLGIQPPTDSLINTSPKVYIFGTLCGGTCSGTFTDIAYYVSNKLGLLKDVGRSILRGVSDPEVIGLFTISDLGRVHDAKNRKTVVNCWAALRELDFYYQKEGRYLVTLPDGNQINTPNEPFDTVYVESLKNRANTGFDSTDYDGLAQMCAMNLFTEVVAGLAAKKDESRVNLRSHAVGYLERNQTDHMRALSSFGLSAFWYPKYRIALAINRQLAVEMCDGWLGGEVQASPIRDGAVRDWTQIVSEAKNSLTGAAPNAWCNKNLQAEIEQAFDQREAEFIISDATDLERSLVNFPSEQSTFALRLSGPNGDYFSRMNNAEPLVARDLKNALSGLVERYFGEHTCAETKEYVAALGRVISEAAERLPNDLPGLSQQMDLELSSHVFSGWWTKLVGLHDKSKEEYKRSLWRMLRERVLAHLNTLSDYFVRQVLQRLQADLINLQNQVVQAETRLRVFRGKCEREKIDLITLKPPGHIVILAAGEQNTVAEDVDLGARQIIKGASRETLRHNFVAGDKPMHILAAESEKELNSRVDRAFGQYSQSITSGFKIGGKALATSRTRIPDLLNRAAPYVETIASFRPLETTQTPNFLFCSDGEVSRQLVLSINEKLKDDRYSPATSPLDHFVIFYHEAVGLALSDLAICHDANRVLAEVEADAGQIATNYTHKQGEKMFDPKAIRDIYKLTQWIGTMKNLAPEIFQVIGKDHCLDYKTTDGLSKLLLVENQDAVRKYVEENGADSLTSRFVSHLAALGKPVVVERMDVIWVRAASVADKETLTKTHEEVIKAVFP